MQPNGAGARLAISTTCTPSSGPIRSPPALIFKELFISVYGTVLAGRVILPAQQEGERRARRDRPPSVPEERRRHRARSHDRVAPRVQGDQLGQQFGAHPVRLAGDRVDPQPVAHRAALASWAAWAVAAGHGPWPACQRRSFANTRSALTASPAP